MIHMFHGHYMHQDIPLMLLKVKQVRAATWITINVSVVDQHQTALAFAKLLAKLILQSTQNKVWYGKYPSSRENSKASLKKRGTFGLWPTKIDNCNIILSTYCSEEYAIFICFRSSNVLFATLIGRGVAY